MSYKNIYFRLTAALALLTFVSNTLSPIVLTSSAVGNVFYVDSVSWDDNNSGTADTAAWASVSMVNASMASGTILPGDTVYFRCGDSWWSEDLTITTNGITFDRFQNGLVCGTGTRPVIRSISANSMSNTTVNGLQINASMSWSAIDFTNSSNVTLYDNAISNSSGSCLSLVTGSGITLDSNDFSLCSYALNAIDIGGSISNNTFSGMTADALQILSSQSLSVNNNTFSYLQKWAIVFGQATVVSQNIISNVCQWTGTGCSAIRNEEFSPANTSYLSARVSENIIQNVGSGITNGNYGISARSIRDLEIANNTVNNAEESLHLEDTNSFNIHNNTLVMPRARVVQVIQNTPGTVGTNTFQSNTILGKNPDYPYIEMRDETVGGTMGSFLSFSSTDFFPLFKPNTSYIREVKYGWETREYGKAEFSTLDPTATQFSYFGYKPYSTTGNLVWGNQVWNGNFLTNTGGWTVWAESGPTPNLLYNPWGSYSGWSATVSPAWGSPDRIWITNNTTIPLTVWRNYQITGYVKSASGNINLRAFLHSASDKNIVYSDRIAETYASASGRTFSFYLQAMTWASDANITIETSNPDVAYEIDEVSVQRVNPLLRNNTANEIHIMPNTTASSLSQPCPGWVCSEYVDELNIPISWNIAIPAYRTKIAFWNNDTANMLTPPTCTVLPDNGSLPAWQPVNVTWTATDSLSQILHYTTYTGSVTLPVASTWVVTFIPSNSGWAIVTISLDTQNDIWPKTCSANVTTNNTPPQIFTSIFAGTEDDAQISGTLSGVDVNPGDSVIFEIITPPSVSQWTLNLVDSTTWQTDFYPNPDFCGTATFDFRARDQWFNYADPITQSITVDCVNDTPFLNSPTKSASGYTAMASLIDLIEWPSGDFDDPDAIYQWQIYTVNFTQPTNGSVVLWGSATQLQYTSNLGFSGTDSFQYSITDQSGATTATGTINVLVTRYNNPPVAYGTWITLLEDWFFSWFLSGSDLDGDPLTFSLLSWPTFGTASVSPSGSFTYTPNPNFNWTLDGFGFRVSDNQWGTTWGYISIDVTSVPDAPVAVADSFTLPQDTMTSLPVMGNDSDVDSSTLTLTWYTQPTHGTLVVNGTSFDYTPNSGYVGSDSFTYRLEDDTSLLSSPVTVTLTVTSTNSAPTTSDMSVSVNEDGVLNSTLSGSDPDMDTLTYSINTFPTHGTLTPSSTGAFRYTPNANYYGTDSFTYHASDAALSSTISTVAITINPVNDAPVGTPASYSVTPNTNSSSGNIFTGVVVGTDIDSGILTFTASMMPTHGTLTLASSWAFTYTPALWYIGSDSFAFIVSDGSLQSSATIVSFTIWSAPVASPGPSTGPGGGGGGWGWGWVSLPNPVVTPTTTTGTVQLPVIPKKPDTKTGATTNTEDPEFNSAPEIQAPQFVLYDPTGLLSQLMLTNRVLTASGLSPIFISPIIQITLAQKVFGEIPTLMLDDFDGPAILRSMLQMFVMEADNQWDVLETYSNAIDYVGWFDFSDSKRMKNTQNYILRILERNRKHYEQIVQRDIFSRFEGELNSASEEIQTTDF